ncbi:MAG TPA: 3-hydroxyacyl-CoA dehydrogenase NAD-binding domain-containing protein [Candidatus Sulfotelmatobacter sp.]|nr:3-hydroxyacyl-CoA dehydrogenase NAD-binding domain-containing protein [Candidatus Sulfotelmatobacter sp.]
MTAAEGEAAPVRRVMIVGAGTMGLGVAKSFAAAGFETSLWSRRAANLTGLPSGVSAVAALPAEPPDLVLENVPEEVAVKREVYRALEAAYPSGVIIATNTSGLSLDELAAELRHPECFLGAHYFQPADVFPMVEVIAATGTAPEAVARVAEAMRQTGKEPILVRKPVPGFLINRLQHAILHEAYHLVESGVASAAEIDAVAKQLLGPRMCVTGLIEQKDIGGLEIHAAAQRAIVPALAHGNRPVAYVQDMVARGETGLKSGKGFYDWSACDRLLVAAQAAARLRQLLQYLQHDLGPPAPTTIPRDRSP